MSVCGEVFNVAEIAEPPAAADVAVLLEAPAFRDWESWTLRKRGRLTLLTGSQFDWHGPVEFVLSSGDGNMARPMESYCATYRSLGTESNSVLKDALTLNALGVDCPSSLAPFNVSPLFAPVETQFGQRLAWWSVESQWAAWASIQDLLTPGDIARLVRRLSEFPVLVKRLRVRSRGRNLNV